MADIDESTNRTATASVLGGGPAVLVPQFQKLSLLISEGPAAGTTWLSTSDRCTIGSHDSNDFVIADRSVSRFHCELVVQAGRIHVRDLGSRNGTLVDGVSVEKAFLCDGSVLRLGATAIRLSLTQEQAPLRVSAAESFGLLVGRSAAMRAAFFVLEKAATSDATVLLEGETGTGKDAAAESIHAASARATGPFVVVDCGSIAQNLIESELFGHERGAFTGAVAAHTGAFESADRGTAFLDEIGELPLDLQPKLLRALEQRAVQPVGSRERRPVDVRVIAATNRDLRAAVNDGTFRSDLYYRLAVIGIRMPPLRERPEDIGLIARQLLARLGASEETLQRILSPDFIQRLERAPWTGNVRELRNYLEQCLVFDSPPPLAGHATAPETEPDVHGSYAQARQRALDAFERRFVKALLEQTDGNVSEAARRADIARGYLHRIIRRHGL